MTAIWVSGYDSSETRFVGDSLRESHGSFLTPASGRHFCRSNLPHLAGHALACPPNRNPRQSAHVAVSGLSTFGPREVFAVGREPSKSNLASLAHLFGSDLPNVTTEVMGPWVICRVHPDGVAVVVHCNIRRTPKSPSPFDAREVT